MFCQLPFAYFSFILALPPPSSTFYECVHKCKNIKRGDRRFLCNNKKGINLFLFQLAWNTFFIKTVLVQKQLFYYYLQMKEERPILPKAIKMIFVLSVFIESKYFVVLLFYPQRDQNRFIQLIH
jgi:hypothetical protein